ncbi:putative F420-0 ABC transporter permease subunit [Devosia sp.]|uniref:putative F420-0 ABC transporter permease subunit n=1 Tax=Devosia sp. TaxID=1871048 RepID=UPI0025E2A380|nr:putative F420-0 ABC transporter permease subunit [Devosia sp.]MCR6633386.1 iron chelate uptake ABC transporter family permease subunit [Devosia sp.]
MTRSLNATAYIALWLLLIASATIAVTFGPADITPTEVWTTILHHLGLVPESPVSRLRDAIVWDLRMPRVIAAMGVGAGLALAGAVMQALTRNPLADPYLLGLSSGAALGAVTLVVMGFALLVPVGAFVGSLAALGLALLIAQLLGGATPVRAILAGISISALASAMTSFIIFWSATGDSYREILSWLMGSLSGSGWVDAGLVAASLLVCAPVMLISARGLDAFAFGEKSAASLGVDVGRLRWTLLGASALLTGVMVAIGGAIGFVGLVVPHAVRLAVGSRHGKLLPLSMLVGAIFMLWADTMARTLFDPRELPVGIVTALVGAPAFLLILMRFRRVT